MLQNIGLSFDEVEDRLLLTVTEAPADAPPIMHNLHLTRRTCAVWRQVLQAMVDLSAQPPDRLAPATKAAVSSAHHQAMAAKTDLRLEPHTKPLPKQERAALVTQIACGRRRADDRWVLRFACQNRPTLSLYLSDATLHALVQALSLRLKTTAWNLPSLPAEAPPESLARADSPLH